MASNGVIGGVNCLVSLAGTIKHAQLAAIKHDREVIARYRAQAVERGGSSGYFVYAATDQYCNFVGPNFRSNSYDHYLSQSEKEIDAIKD